LRKQGSEEDELDSEDMELIKENKAGKRRLKQNKVESDDEQ
jgi:hypothetical protein